MCIFAKILLRLIMKKIVFLACLLMALAAVTSAQTTISVGPASRGFNAVHAANALVVDEDATSLLMVTNKSAVLSKSTDPKNLLVRKVDKSLSVLNEVEIPHTDDMKLMAASTDGNHVAMLYSDRSRRSTQVYRTLVDRTSFQVVSTDVVYTADLERRDENHVWAYTSQNGHYTGLVSVLVSKSGEYSCDILMFDAQFALLWERQFSLQAVSDIFVSDHGEVYVAGFHRKDLQTKVYFERMTASDEASDSTLVQEGLLSLAIVNVAEGRILVGGATYSTESHRHDNYASGFYALSFNMDSHQQMGFSVAQLTHDDLAVFLDQKQSAKIRKAYVEQLIIDRTCATEYGGALSFFTPFNMQETSSNGEVTQYFSHIGYVVLGVDFSGRVLFNAPFRHYQSQVNGYNLLNAPLTSDGKFVYFAHTESKKSPDNYDIAKRTKKVTTLRDKCSNVLYVISNSGEVTKTFLSTKQKSVLLGRTQSWLNNSYYFFNTHGRASQLVQLKSE